MLPWIWKVPPTEAFLRIPKLPVVFAVTNVNSSVTVNVPPTDALPKEFILAPDIAPIPPVTVNVPPTEAFCLISKVPVPDIPPATSISPVNTNDPPTDAAPTLSNLSRPT